jgi:hypothetical protein
MPVELKTTLEKLYEKYFLPGNYIIDFPENYQDKETLEKKPKFFSQSYFIFNEKYNSILDTCILESIQTIKLLDISVEVIIHKPIKKVHRYEFEEYFGFGGHCEGFNSNKKIISCPKYKKIELDELLSKIDIDILNDNKIIELCLIMFLLGFWNKRQAINDLLNFLESEINPDTIFEYLFQKL